MAQKTNFQEERTLTEISKGLHSLVFGRPKWRAQVSIVSDWIGTICIIIGVVSDVSNRVLGLEPTNWFLLGLAFFVAGLWKWIMAYAAIKKE
jgi:hypothetical protein